MSARPYQVLIVNAFERKNRGDAVLLSVMLSQLQEAHPGAEIGIAGFEDPAVLPTFEGVANLGSIRRWLGEEQISRPRRISRKAGLAVLSLVALLGRPALQAVAPLVPAEPRRELTGLLEADLVVSLSGGHLNGKPSIASDLNIAFLLWPLWVANRLGTATVLGPQSFGPFPRPVQRRMVRSVLNKVSTILVREDISVDQLRRTGVDHPLMARAVDGAFSYRHRADAVAPLGLPSSARIVSVTARQWLPPQGQQRFERAMRAATEHLLELGYHVVFVPQVTCEFQGDDDRLVHTRITAGLDHPRLVVLNDDTIDHDGVRAIFAASTLVLGTRFHSVIFSLSAYVPCVAVQYDHKTRGIMADLGLEQWVLDIDDTDEAGLVAAVDRLIAQRADYVEHLNAVIPPYIERSDTTVRWLRHPGRPLVSVAPTDTKPLVMTDR